MGCDYEIDSNAVEDRCGVCHGNGSTCETVKKTFKESEGLGMLFSALKVALQSPFSPHLTPDLLNKSHIPIGGQGSVCRDIAHFPFGVYFTVFILEIPPFLQ